MSWIAWVALAIWALAYVAFWVDIVHGANKEYRAARDRDWTRL